MMPVVPGGLPSVPRLTVMPQSSASSSPSAPTPVALVPNIAAGNNSITIQVKVLNFVTCILTSLNVGVLPFVVIMKFVFAIHRISVN